MTTPNKTPPGADPNQLKRTGTVREIGSQAVWSLSSCKPGFGVDQLRDDNLETYWQSDGSQPHLVNIQFRRKTTVKALCIYADYKSDESYTPSKISVRVGNNFHNLQEIRQLELVEPSGWIHVPLTDAHKKPIRTFMIQIAVLANHQNGRDTHMRQIKVFTPVEESSIGRFPRCTTIDFMMHRFISKTVLCVCDCCTSHLNNYKLKVTGSIISPSSLNKQPSLYTQSAVKPVKQMQNTLEENVETLLSHARYNSQFKYKNRSIVQQWCSSTSGERSYSRSFPVITVTVSKSDCAPSRNCSGSPASCVVFPCY
uniref:Anaphase-promoting complex subunit 10 n=2 Tax=Xenopus TaxID=8353 RepID=A0A803JH20_XENTR